LKKKNTPPPELKGLFCELKTAWNPTRQDNLTGKKGVNHRLRRACPFAVVVRQWAHTGRGTVSKVRGLMIRVVLCFCGRRKRLLFGSSFHFLKVKQFLSCCRNRAPSLFFSLIPRRDATDLGAGHHQPKWQRRARPIRSPRCRPRSERTARRVAGTRVSPRTAVGSPGSAPTGPSRTPAVSHSAARGSGQWV
jgi:hypothetical protein